MGVFRVYTPCWVNYPDSFDLHVPVRETERENLIFVKCYENLGFMGYVKILWVSLKKNIFFSFIGLRILQGLL